MEGSIFSKIAAIWSAITEWFAGSFDTIEALFWTGTDLTFLGTLSVVSLGISVFFLLVGVITNFIKLRN